MPHLVKRAEAIRLHRGLSRSGKAEPMLVAPPRTDVRAWFTLAVTAPAVLLCLAETATLDGASRLAGLWIAVLLAPTVALALRSLETRAPRPGPHDPAAAARAREAMLKTAFRLTTAEACGVLLAVLLGAPLAGQSVALGLAVAGLPLALAVADCVLAPVRDALRLETPVPVVAVTLRAAPALVFAPAPAMLEPLPPRLRRNPTDTTQAPALRLATEGPWLRIVEAGPEPVRRGAGPFRPIRLWVPAGAVDPDPDDDAVRFDQALGELRNLLSLYRPKPAAKRAIAA